MIFFYQSLGQLKKVFAQGADQTFLSNMDVQIYFGINDIQTAEHVSQRIGECTLQIVSDSGGDSRSKNYDPNGLESGSKGTNRGGPRNR